MNSIAGVTNGEWAKSVQSCLVSFPRMPAGVAAIVTDYAVECDIFDYRKYSEGVISRGPIKVLLTGYGRVRCLAEFKSGEHRFVVRTPTKDANWYVSLFAGDKQAMRIVTGDAGPFNQVQGYFLANTTKPQFFPSQNTAEIACTVNLDTNIVVARLNGKEFGGRISRPTGSAVYFAVGNHGSTFVAEIVLNECFHTTTDPSILAQWKAQSEQFKAESEQSPDEDTPMAENKNAVREVKNSDMDVEADFVLNERYGLFTVCTD